MKRYELVITGAIGTTYGERVIATVPFHALAELAGVLWWIAIASSAERQWCQWHVRRA